MTTYTKHAVKGAAIVLIVSLIAGFLGYLVRLILARNLTLEEFGLFYAVLAFLGLIGFFKSLGFDRALVKFIPEFLHKKDDSRIKSSIVYVGLILLITNSVIIIAVYFISNFLAVNFFNNPQADIVLRLMAIAFFLDSFVLMLKFAFQGFKKMMYFSGIDAIRMLLIITIMLIGFKLSYGLFIPVYAYILAPIVLMIVSGIILVKFVFPKFFVSEFFFDKKLLKGISKYGIFVTATSIGTAMLYYTDTLALTYFAGLEAVALYSVALPTAKILLFIPRAIGGMLWPLTSELWAKKEKKIIIVGIESLFKYSVIFIVPLVFIIFSFAELIIVVFYGKAFVLASNAMKILVVGMIFAVLYGITINFFAGIGKPQIISKIVYIAGIFNLIADIVLIPVIGMIGAAIATTISHLIMMAMGLLEIRKYIKLSFPVKVWAKTLLAGILFTATIWLLKWILTVNVWLETFIILLIAGFIYVALLFLFKIMSIKEVKDLYSRIR